MYKMKGPHKMHVRCHNRSYMKGSRSDTEELQLLSHATTNLCQQHGPTGHSNNTQSYLGDAVKHRCFPLWNRAIFLETDGSSALHEFVSNELAQGRAVSWLQICWNMQNCGCLSKVGIWKMLRLLGEKRGGFGSTYYAQRHSWVGVKD